MKLFCPQCRSTFEEDLANCPHDGSRLFQLESTEDPLIGAIMDDRFRVDWVLGAGGMGTVYRGMQLSVNREVAIKVLRAELTDRELALERFFREAKLVSELTHPNIVRLIDFGQDRQRDLLYLVMELVRGTNLSDLLSQGRFRVNMALEVVYQICGALTEPHARGVIHRDLKPDNLLLVPVSDGTVQVKVLDFGIARVLQGNTQLTATGMICGTPAYMAPEQAQNFGVDARTDLYALGVILYEMLLGQPPFMGTSSLQIMLKHIQEVAKPLRDCLPPGTLPEDIEELVYNLISKNPDDRHASARSVRDAIDEIRVKHGFRPVRLERDAKPEEMFKDWILPRLPNVNYIKSGPTQALRRETGLDLATLSRPSPAGELPPRDSAEYRELGLADTELGRTSPMTPEKARSIESDAVRAGQREQATRQGAAQGWTPGDQAALNLHVKEEAPRPAPQPKAASPTSMTPRADASMSMTAPRQSTAAGGSAPRSKLLYILAPLASLLIIGLSAALIYVSTTGSKGSQEPKLEGAASQPVKPIVETTPTPQAVSSELATTSGVDEADTRGPDETANALVVEDPPSKPIVPAAVEVEVEPVATSKKKKTPPADRVRTPTEAKTETKTARPDPAERVEPKKTAEPESPREPTQPKKTEESNIDRELFDRVNSLLRE